MKNKIKKTSQVDTIQNGKAIPENAADTNYSSSDDIYVKAQRVKNINPDDLSKTEHIHQKTSEGKFNEKDFVEDLSGSDLDIPGAESNDDEMITGLEDEENDFYSIGGDNHNDLEEDRGN